MRRIWLALKVGVLLCGLGAGCAAQSPNGVVRGVVLDASGATVEGALVSLRAEGSQYQRQMRSGAAGEFRFDEIPAGRYRVSGEAAGFAKADEEAVALVARVTDTRILLRPAGEKQSVTVSGKVSSVTTEPMDSASAVQQAVITSHDLETLPLAARSFANIAYLAPGTEPVEPSDPTKARITAVSSGGSSGLNMELSVDGGDNSDDYIGGFLQNFSPDSIQEFAVRTALADADTGRTVGSSVVITTKHGTDDWRGEFGFYERDAALNARLPVDNPAQNPKQPFSRQNYVGTLGGPAIRSKLWIYSSLEYVHEDASIAYSNASQNEFAALAQLAAQGLIHSPTQSVNSIPVPNSVGVPFRDYLGLFRVDWAQSVRSHWFTRAANDSYTTRNAFVQQGALPSTGAVSHNNYFNLLINNQFVFSPTWVGTLVLEASALHLTQSRNTNLGFSLAFPFTSTSSTISGLETFGDNNFITPITAFPVLRNQEKYQLRYDISHEAGRHAPRFGVNFIHEPVLSGALAATAEYLYAPPNDPSYYLAHPAELAAIVNCDPNQAQNQPPNAPCPFGSFTPAGDGTFSQNVQRLGFYAQDSWRVNSRLTINYGLRYDTTFGLFIASGRSQAANPTLSAVPDLVRGAPHDYRKAVAPRLGVAYALGAARATVIRAGVGLYYNDLAQNGWVTAFQAVNGTNVANPAGAPPSLIDPNYRTPYALHAVAGVQHAFSARWIASADWTHETGMHSYRRYEYQAGFSLPASDPSVSLFRTDNRSSYDALSLRLQGNAAKWLSFEASYTLATAKTWGCVLGELFDYVNGVCNPLQPFGKGDYGPSGEDVRHRFVLAGTFHAPGGVELTTLSQAESARPYTLTTPVDVNGFGDATNDRAVVNGVQTSLDQLRGSPYVQVDLRASRPLQFRERITVTPFVEFFNLFNRNNPGANFVTNVGALPVNDPANVTAICPNGKCTPITNLNQLRVPAGALGDFFGPGTTVGIPFAAQGGVRLSF